ncbi:peptide-methionine (S)-S-oxide reductase MsrA [Croceicoccus sp. F390]|uniref:Peptide methionine sulfoxide reductase MsrA n=1 Tax=Croceicoccus esteveae TaxID=3075597 RepID=A0ABU2ZHN7_9SPHN|nr:peptide-methionine (S)-S-oxide reductase MsrA [Croceicoccus sp. F390]MDT0576117.1 peptide-methionine (S)-S-oxide reductase MsrA [Croceicoccus sp. F390]
MKTPVAAVQASETPGLKTALFAGGCFWGVEAVFSHVNGVTSAVSGYHGGNADDANYASVSSGATRHAEVVKITYDPSIVRYDELLQIYFGVVADPTLLNRQGPDRGAQYRSAIIPVESGQTKVARAYLNQLGEAGLWTSPVVTKIEPYKAFHLAERKHQDFAHKNPRHPYITRWDAPKIRNLRAIFPGHYRPTFREG